MGLVHSNTSSYLLKPGHNSKGNMFGLLSMKISEKVNIGNAQAKCVSAKRGWKKTLGSHEKKPVYLPRGDIYDSIALKRGNECLSWQYIGRALCHECQKICFHVKS